MCNTWVSFMRDTVLIFSHLVLKFKNSQTKPIKENCVSLQCDQKKSKKLCFWTQLEKGSVAGDA